jgi:K+-sensing histidine kinase KdpD
MDSVPPARKPPTIQGYLVALAVVAASLFARWSLQPLLGGSRPYLTLFAGIALAAWLKRWKPAAVAAAVGFFVANRFFTPSPHFDTFLAEAVGYALSAGLIIFAGEEMHRARERADREPADRRAVMWKAGNNSASP